MRKYLCKKESRRISYVLGSVGNLYRRIKNIRKTLSLYKYPFFWLKLFFWEKDVQIKLMRMRLTLKKFMDLGLIAEQDWEKLEAKRLAIIKGEKYK